MQRNSSAHGIKLSKFWCQPTFPFNRVEERPQATVSDPRCPSSHKLIIAVAVLVASSSFVPLSCHPTAPLAFSARIRLPTSLFDARALLSTKMG